MCHISVCVYVLIDGQKRKGKKNCFLIATVTCICNFNVSNNLKDFRKAIIT